ncbi:MAG: c-type cytochrome, partial [Candidatus Hydrothermarchaeales archaeon]
MMRSGDHREDIGIGMIGSPTTKSVYSSNGERIYYAGTSNSGKTITADMGMGPMMSSMMTCVNCHGEDGKGGKIQMMMGTYEVPDIRYSVLTEEEHGHEGEEHPPYTEELIKKALTEGIEPDGEQLEFPMPRWSMSDEDLDDLIDYLKTL